MAFHKSMYSVNPVSSNYYQTVSASIPTKHTYNILGEEIQFDLYPDFSTASFISCINLLGEKYYLEFKKQGVSIPKELDDYLINRFKIINRDEKINTIVNGNV